MLNTKVARRAAPGMLLVVGFVLSLQYDKDMHRPRHRGQMDRGPLGS